VGGQTGARAAFDGGHYATVASHGARWRRFCTWAREQGVGDVRRITPSDLAQFATHLRQQTNRGYEHRLCEESADVRERCPGVAAGRSKTLGQTRRLSGATLRRLHTSSGRNRARPAEEAVDVLVGSGRERVAAVALLCREHGLRRREACLLDLRLARLQAARTGRINVTAGTKGGR
jgi:hypothetical protein